MPSKKYRLRPWIANEKNVPTVIEGAVLRQTDKGGVYLFGHGSSDPEGVCCKCGRRLTHPVSILTGIGPECGSHWWNPEVLGPFGFTEAHAEALRAMIREQKVDCWLPASQFEELPDFVGTVQVPDNHPMLNGIAKKAAPRLVAKAVAGGMAELRFGYDAALIAKVKDLPGRRWDGAAKCWRVPASCAAKLETLGFELDADLMAIAHPVEVKVMGEEIGIPGLYPFQARGIEWLQQHRGRGLLADEMGLGKTIQAAGWLKLNPEARPAVIVVPASLKINWVRELEKWIGSSAGVVVLSGKRANAKALAGARIIIINYDILGAWLRAILDWKPVALIADESHYIKSTKAARTKAVRALAQNCKHTIFLTGTPITNRPVEFFSVLNLLDPAQFANWHRYTEKYCGAYQDRWGWQVGGATNTLELHERVSGHLMLRRKKEDVLRDLPAKRRMVVPLEINNRREYEAADEDLLDWIRESFSEENADAASRAEALVRFSVLKQMAAEGKRAAALEWIENALENNGKLVVFAVHHKMIDWLRESLASYQPAVVDGRVSLTQRQDAVDRFQNDPACRVFIGNIKAAGVGITLTAASTTAFVELGWTPGEHDQAEDRVHRIGQEAARVEAYYLVASATIEEEISAIIDRKRVVLNEVLDGRDTESSSLLTELLRSRRRPAKGERE